MENVNEIMEECRFEMDAAIEHLERELAKIRAGKANPSMLSSVKVEYYGAPTPLLQVAAINTPDARSLSIKPFEKSLLPDIEKAIFASNLGFTPQSDGENIRINIPALTEERRRDLAKQIRAEGEHAKISLRNARKTSMDAIKQLNKDGLSDDLSKDAEGSIQNVTNEFAEKVTKLIAAKENEVTTM